MKDKEEQTGAESRGFFKPKHVKEGKLLLRGVRKFVRYNRDLISSEQGKKVEVIEGEFRETLDRPGVTKEELNEAAVKLTEACEKSVPSYKSSMLKENLEVIFVAVVIAMGIRAYFVQPFKIPTGSMQPTLNGIIAYSASRGRFSRWSRLHRAGTIRADLGEDLLRTKLHKPGVRGR